MITFLDQELSNQEEKNDYKEGLMNKALDSIQGAGPQSQNETLRTIEIHSVSVQNFYQTCLHHSMALIVKFGVNYLPNN